MTDDFSTRIQQISPDTLMARLGIAWVEASAETVVASMPVEGNVQPFGALHGGATAALCESAASLGAAIGGGEDRVASGIDLNINHLRRVTDGIVTATATPLHTGRSTAVWDVRVVDAAAQLVAVARVTLALRDR